MIAFLHARHPEVASRKFRWLSEAPLDVRAWVGLGPEWLADDGVDRLFGKAVSGHAGEGVLTQDDRFHDAIVATFA